MHHVSLIQVTNAAFRYDGKEVVSDLNFSVERGDYLCIVGENGSGKSTLIKGLLGLKSPHNGSIVFGEGLNAHEIGYLPQQKESQRDFPASVQEVVLSGTLNSLGLQPFYTRKQREITQTQIDLRRHATRRETQAFATSPAGSSSARCLRARLPPRKSC